MKRSSSMGLPMVVGAPPGGGAPGPALGPAPAPVIAPPAPAIGPAPGGGGAPAPVNRNEQFDIINFYMGQGDCSMIRCPDGKIVMIDCGSTSDFPDENLQVVMDQVRHTDWAGNNMCIDALILTHSDADHHNKVVSVLGEYTYKASSSTSSSTTPGPMYSTSSSAPTITMPSTTTTTTPTTTTTTTTTTTPTITTTTMPTTTPKKWPKLKIDKIYLSCAYGDKSSLGNYTGNALNTNVYNDYFKTSEIYEVTICEGSSFYKKWTKDDTFGSAVPPDSTKPADTTWPIANQKYTILNGTTAGGQLWSVSIIAGNVKKEKGPITDLGLDEEGNPFVDTATPDNACSLITLFEIGGKKALFCGDATFSTEHFLVQQHATLISNVDFLLAPHHGSEYASSIDFVELCRPKTVVVSCGFMHHGFKHPRATAIFRWLAKVQAAAAHEIDYWDMNADMAEKVWHSWEDTFKDLTTGQPTFDLHLDWSHKADNFGIDQATFIWLQATPALNDYYGVCRDKYGIWQAALFRMSTGSDLSQTALIDQGDKTTPQFINKQIG